MQVQYLEEVSDPKKTERVYVAVDVQNIWYSSREQFGSTARVNFDKLKYLILNKQLSTLPRELNLVAYTITASTKVRADGQIRYVGKKNDRFLETLTRIGFSIRNRDMFSEKGIKKPFHTDWDVGITLDAVNYIDEYDTFTLVSGDGDYSILIEDLRKRGKFVEVITFETTASRLLHATANRVIYITESELYFQEQRRGEDSKENAR